MSFIRTDYRVVLFLQIFTGVALYIILSWLFKLSSFKLILDYIKKGLLKIKGIVGHNKDNGISKNTHENEIKDKDVCDKDAETNGQEEYMNDDERNPNA